MDPKPEYTLEDQMRGLIEQLDAYINTYHGGSVDYVAYEGRIVKVRLGEPAPNAHYPIQLLKGGLKVHLNNFSLMKWNP